MLKKDYNTLSDMIASGRVTFVSNMLAKHSDIDIMYFNGEFLRLAIQNPGSNPKITKLLLDYFKNVQLPKFRESSNEYNNLQSRFKIYLENAASEEKLSQEMMEVLSEYINTLGEETSESELDSRSATNLTSNSFEQDSDIENYNTNKSNSVSEAEDVGLMYGNLTTTNLIKPNYEYIRISQEAEKDYKNALYQECIDKITRSASAIYANRKYSNVNKELKSGILYKYLCFYNDNKIASEINLNNPWKFIDLKIYGYEILQNAICDSNYDITKLLLEKVPDAANMSDKFGQTLLHWASDNPEITEMLLNTMSNDAILKQAEGNNNYTALHLAVHNKNNQVVEFHLNRVPELSNIQDKFGRTPLDLRSDNSEITEMLLNVNLENFLTGSSSSTESIIDESRGILHNEVKLLGNIDDMSLTENNES